MTGRRTVARATRLIYILRLLEDRPRTTREIAELFRVHVRTIQRDMLDIQGEPLYAPVVREGVWMLAKNCR